MSVSDHQQSYWRRVGSQFARRKVGMAALAVVALFCLVAIYAPLLASSNPLVVKYHGVWYFPLFRYLFYTGYYTKVLDIFFNIFIYTFTLGVGLFFCLRNQKRVRRSVLIGLVVVHLALFVYFASGAVKNPAADLTLNREKQEAFQVAMKETGHGSLPSWNEQLRYMNDYAKLNYVLKYQREKNQQERFQQFAKAYRDGALKRWMARAIQNKRASLMREGIPEKDLPDKASLEQSILKETPAHIIITATSMPTLWQSRENQRSNELSRLEKTIKAEEVKGDTSSWNYRYAVAKRQSIIDEDEWLQQEVLQLHYEVMPFLRSFHWEEDAGGDQSLNRYVNWWELTRINRKDMLAALIFGVRISLIVGLLSVLLALLIGVPIGAYAGFYGGTFDIIVCRLLEIWESMPTFFMLLLVVAITQSKSIILIILVIGIFGWTTFSRYVRGEFFKQRVLSYVEACHATGFHNRYIIFSHILPNAIPPLLTLLPFAIMGAITSEAGLSFLGLGEEGSCSWGVLMDEGRSAFPAESYLLWPPAILLTVLLIAIALVGDALRDTLDPKVVKT